MCCLNAVYISSKIGYFINADRNTVPAAKGYLNILPFAIKASVKTVMKMRARVHAICLLMCLSAASIDHIRSDSAIKGNTVLYMEESSS